MKLIDQIKLIADGAPYGFESAMSLEEAVRAIRPPKENPAEWCDGWIVEIDVKPLEDGSYAFSVSQDLWGRLPETIRLNGRLSAEGERTLVTDEIPIHNLQAIVLTGLVAVGIVGLAIGQIGYLIGCLVLAWLSVRHFTSLQLRLLGYLEKTLKITKSL